MVEALIVRLVGRRGPRCVRGGRTVSGGNLTRSGYGELRFVHGMHLRGWQSRDNALCLSNSFLYLFTLPAKQNDTRSAPNTLPLPISSLNHGAADKTASVAAAYGNTLRICLSKARPPLSHYYHPACVYPARHGQLPRPRELRINSLHLAHRRCAQRGRLGCLPYAVVWERTAWRKRHVQRTRHIEHRNRAIFQESRTR